MTVPPLGMLRLAFDPLNQIKRISHLCRLYADTDDETSPLHPRLLGSFRV